MNSVRYICGECGTHFDIPVNYVNRKVRCKCGNVDVATATEIEELAPLPPPVFSRPAPQYRPEYESGYDDYAPRKPSKAKNKKRKEYDDRRPMIVTIYCMLAFISLPFSALRTLRSMISIFSSSIIPENEKGKVVGMLALGLLAVVVQFIAYLMLWGKAKAGLILLTILHLIAYAIVIVNSRFDQFIMAGCIIVFLVVVGPIWLVHRRLD